MRKIITLLLLASVLSCTTDESTEQTPNRAFIRNELNLFIKKEIELSSTKNISPKIVEFMHKKFGFVEIDKSSPIYSKKVNELLELNKFARINECDREVTLITDSSLAPECWVYVIEYGNGCTNQGCIKNTWECDRSDGSCCEWSETLIC